MNFLHRFKEPSTYTGLAVLGTLFNIKEFAAFGAPEVAIALAGLASVFMGEKAKPAPAPAAPPEQN